MSVEAIQSRLLGISGLLPVELSRSRTGADAYIQRVWDQWWRERDSFSDCILPREVWRLHGLRPANHPQRRLALAAQWSVRSQFLQKIEEWCALSIPNPALPETLLSVLETPSDEFWCRHFTLRSGQLAKERPLLGASRVSELAVNVVLPWLWSRASEGKNEAVRKVIQARYFAWPRSQDNSVLRLARNRLLGGIPPEALPGSAAQQGLIQIVRDFCDQSNPICDKCRFPELVKQEQAKTSFFVPGSTNQTEYSPDF